MFLELEVCDLSRWLHRAGGMGYWQGGGGQGGGFHADAVLPLGFCFLRDGTTLQDGLRFTQHTLQFIVNLVIRNGKRKGMACRPRSVCLTLRPRRIRWIFSLFGFSGCFFRDVIRGETAAMTAMTVYDLLAVITHTERTHIAGAGFDLTSQVAPPHTARVISQSACRGIRKPVKELVSCRGIFQGNYPSSPCLT